MGQLTEVLRIYVSVALQQKTANVKVAIVSRAVQWGAISEGKQKNQFAHTECHIIL